MMHNLRSIREHGFKDGYKKALDDVLETMDGQTLYHDDGTHAQMTANQWKNIIKKKIEELR